MSKIGKNIRKIRTVKKLSQASFAQLFNLARPSVGAYEEGRAEPKIDTILQIANHFGLSADALLTKDLTINDLFRFDSLQQRRKTADTPVQQPGKIMTARMNTCLVSTGRFLDYIQNHRNSDFLDSLPKGHFPGIRSVLGRAFEMDNQAMGYDQSGILPGDFVICDRKIEQKEEFHNGQVYVLVVENNIMVRRFGDIKKRLRLTADNPDWPNVFLDFNQLLECWEAGYILTGNLSPPVDMKKRLSTMEEKIDQLSKRLAALENRKK